MTHPSSTSSRSTAPLVLVGVLVLVVVVAVVAFLVTRDGDGDGDDAAPVATTPLDDGEAVDDRLPPELAGEARDVEIEGDPLPPLPDAGNDPALGQRPPTLVAEDASGTVHTISADIDGPYMLVFLAHWCPACNAEVPNLVELDDTGRVPADLDVYGVLTAISPDQPGFPPSEWIADFGWPWVAVADGVDFDVDPPQWAAAEAFGLSAFPYVVLVDDGIVVDRWAGELGVDALADRLATRVG
ncbi:MAG: TlpA disulfide reductase family protein [Ilumatobacteraceae bacterium]